MKKSRIAVRWLVDLIMLLMAVAAVALVLVEDMSKSLARRVSGNISRS